MNIIDKNDIMCEREDIEKEIERYQDSLKKRKAMVLKLHYDLRRLSLDISRLRDKLKEEPKRFRY